MTRGVDDPETDTPDIDEIAVPDRPVGRGRLLRAEHPQQGWRAMRDMVERFITSPRSSCGEVERQLRELDSCD